MQRLFADLSRISGVPVPTLRLPPQLAVGGARLSERLHLGLGPVGRRDALGVALVDLLLGQGEAGARLRRPPARGDARGGPGDDHRAARRPGRRRPRSGRRRCSRSPAARRGWRAGCCRDERGAGPEGRRSFSTAVRRKTNYLCPCGAVDRRLRKLEHRATGPSGCRIAASDRPEIVELTGQTPRAAADRRRRGHPRFEADPASTWTWRYAPMAERPVDAGRPCYTI